MNALSLSNFRLMQVQFQFINSIDDRIGMVTEIHTLGCSFFLLRSLLGWLFGVTLLIFLEMVLPIFDFIIQLTFIHLIIITHQTQKIKMFKLMQELETSGAVVEINRYNNILTAYDGGQDLIEIDLKHELIMRNKLQYPPINVKCFSSEGKWEYYVVTLNQIEKADGTVVSHSNSKAEFTGCIDSFGSSLIFSKYHHNYKKYSINHLWEGTKKIVKLLDTPIKKLVMNPNSYQVIYNTKDIVNCLDLNNIEKDVPLFKKSTFLSDTNNLYTLSLNLENKSKEEYEIGIFDFRTGKNSDSFISKEPPIKIESFSKSLLVATKNAIEIFDLRKLIKPFDRQAVKGIRDFLYEPNINKLFIGCDYKLRVYRTEN